MFLLNSIYELELFVKIWYFLEQYRKEYYRIDQPQTGSELDGCKIKINPKISGGFANVTK
jgi:hypothetical protein